MRSLFLIYTRELSPHVERVLKQDFVEADKLFLALTFFQWFIAGTVSGISYGLYGIGIVGGGIATALATIAYRFYRGTIVCRVVMGVNCAVFTAIYITQQMGRIEAHFSYFIVIGILLRYKDLIPLMVNTVVILTHHYLFTFLQEIGYQIGGVPIFCFNWGPWYYPLAIHSFVALVSISISLYIVHGQIKQFLRNVETNENLESARSSLEKLNNSYSRFVPMEFLDYLQKKSITDVSLGDQVQHDFAIMFVDIRSFTRLSETMTPGDNFDFLNSYLKRISPVISANGGFIDKYIGDAVMALFPKEPEQVLKAAGDIRKALKDFNRSRIEKGLQPINIGIGIHAGSLILGTIGYQDRMEGTVISDAVNMASRLEGLTKKFQCSIIFSEEIEKAISENQRNRFFYRHLGRARVKGKEKSISVFELFNGDDASLAEGKTATKESFEKAVRLFGKAQFEQARRIFLDIRKKNSADLPVQVFLSKIESFQVQQ